MWGEGGDGREYVSTSYFPYEGTHIRNLFLLLVVNNITVEEENKLQN